MMRTASVSFIAFVVLSFASISYSFTKIPEGSSALRLPSSDKSLVGEERTEVRQNKNIWNRESRLRSHTPSNKDLLSEMD